MSKCYKSIFIIGAILFLASCKDNNKENLTGIWKLNVMDINNTPIKGSALGNWLWEFNDEGGYMVNVAGATEKGTYKLNKDKLTLTPVTSKHPPQNYTITKLDSAVLNLSASTEQNKTLLYFIRIKSEDAGEKD